MDLCKQSLNNQGNVLVIFHSKVSFMRIWAFGVDSVSDSGYESSSGLTVQFIKKNQELQLRTFSSVTKTLM